MVMDLSNLGTTLDLSPLRNAIDTGKAFTAGLSTVPALGFAGTPPSPAPGFADTGFAGTPPSPAPVPGLGRPDPATELTDLQALNYVASHNAVSYTHLTLPTSVTV